MVRLYRTIYSSRWVEFKVRGSYFENVSDALLDLENKLFATLQNLTALPRGEK